jgi:hypothetical protein
VFTPETAGAQEIDFCASRCQSQGGFMNIAVILVVLCRLGCSPEWAKNAGKKNNLIA